MTTQDRVDEAVRIGLAYGGTDGEHHKQWVIDQMLRVLLGDAYVQAIRASCTGEDGPDTYSWDEGIPP